MSEGCCLQLRLSVVLLRVVVLSGAASTPLRVLATSQMPLTDCCGRAHLASFERDEELGGPEPILLCITSASGGPGPSCSWPLVVTHIVL